MTDIFPPTLPTSGTIAIVGAGGGMGRVLVEAALSLGLKVAALDLRHVLDGIDLPPEVLKLECDISDENSVAAAFAAIEGAWGALDTLVNLAGFQGEATRLEDLTTEDWDAVTGTCLRGMFLVARAAVPLVRSARGSMVLVASTFAHRVVHPGYAAYAASKAGVVSIGKALATECAPDVRVNVISPGVFLTPFLEGGTGRPRRVEGEIDLESYPKFVPLKRLGDPIEIVGPILFLASPAASYITGQVLHVNGGTWAP